MPTPPTCIETNCTGPVLARGMCKSHYMKWYYDRRRKARPIKYQEPKGVGFRIWLSPYYADLIERWANRRGSRPEDLLRSIITAEVNEMAPTLGVRPSSE